MWLHKGTAQTPRDWGSALEADPLKKSLATPGNQTHISTVLGFLVWHSTNQATLTSTPSGSLSYHITCFNKRNWAREGGSERQRKKDVANSVETYVWQLVELECSLHSHVTTEVRELDFNQLPWVQRSVPISETDTSKTIKVRLHCHFPHNPSIKITSFFKSEQFIHIRSHSERLLAVSKAWSFTIYSSGSISLTIS